MKLLLKRLALYSAVTIGAGLLCVAGVIGYVQLSHIQQIHTDIDTLSPAPYAIILGASVKSNGTPSDALYDRIYLGSELIKAGKVETLLMTGDGGAYHLNEVAAMKRVAMELGVPRKILLLMDKAIAPTKAASARIKSMTSKSDCRNTALSLGSLSLSL
ncbi:MAG: YdcF family protein [Candidatus Nomurabacteria bacterium]|nr:MAG: YdcF family protein [Candidatus Nomurabacteria bacterium]